MRYLTGLLLLLLVLTGCEDKGYGTQDISTVPSVTSSDKVTLLSSVPRDGASIAMRSYINVAFSSYMDENSVSKSNVSLKDTNSSIIKIELEIINNYLYVKPDASLTADHNYTLTIGSSLKDIMGNTLQSTYTLGFQCKSDFWESVDAGQTHSMALSKDGDIYAWGGNTLLQLIFDKDALLVDMPFPIPKVTAPKDFSAGSLSSVIITDKGIIISAGRNALPDSSEAGFEKVSIGDSHTAVVKDDGTLFSWGSNANGELGNLSIFDESEPVQEYYKETNWSDVSAGYAFTMAIKKDGTLWGWGDNEFGQIGNSFLKERRRPVQEDTNATDWREVSAGSDHSVTIKEDGTLWSWGKNDSGELGDGTGVSSKVAVQETRNAVWESVSSGFDHTLAIDENNTLWAWGNSYYGQVGDGNTNSLSPKKIADGNWSSVSAGEKFSLGVKDDGTLWAWGYNGHGQLGVGLLGEDQLVPMEVK